MYAVLGWINIAALVVMTSPYWLRLINKYAFKNKSKALARAAKALRTHISLWESRSSRRSLYMVFWR